MVLLSALESSLEEHIQTARGIKTILSEISSGIELIVETFAKGNKLILAGNGGSAADAQNFAAEWIIRLNSNIDRPAMPAISLTTDSSLITAGTDSIGYENIFARQLEALSESGDLLIVISTSGNSENLIRAIKTAKDKNLRTMGLLGRGGGKIAELTDINIIIPSDDTQRIQEMHEFIGHLLCEYSEKLIYSGV